MALDRGRRTGWQNVHRGTNPKNPTSKLFKRLTRIFSGPITRYQRQTPRREKRRDLDKYKFDNAMGMPFARQSYNPFTILRSNKLAEASRVDRYVDFELMEFSPIIATALDTYADEMTTKSPTEKLLTINCQNEELKDILNELYYNILNIEHNLHGWCRTLVKFGDFFLYLDIEENKGIRNVIGLPVTEVERLEGQDEDNPYYVQFQWNSGGLTFENWQIAHFRILSNDKYYPYGTSILDSSRRIWRQHELLKDAMMAYRIVRSSERLVFHLNVAGIPENEVEQYVERTMTKMKRTAVANPNEGEVDLRYNPISVEENYGIPFRGENKSEITQLSGGQFTGDIDDVTYLLELLFAALRIPQEYLSRGKGESSDKATLAQKDTRFARIIQRLQLALMSELKKIGIIHLYSLGYRGEDLLKFELELNNPSKIAEMQALENWRMKFEAAEAATASGYFSKRWIATNLLGLTPKEHERMIIEQFYDAKVEARFEAMKAMAEGGTGDTFGGGLGELDDMSDIAPEEGLEDEGEDDGVLLASPGEGAETAPGKRDEPTLGEEYITPGSKGKKHKKAWNDNRKSKGTGPRKKGMFGAFAKEFSTSTPRNTFKGIFNEIKQINEEREEVLRLFEQAHEEKIIEENNLFKDDEAQILLLQKELELENIKDPDEIVETKGIIEDLIENKKNITNFIEYEIERLEESNKKDGQSVPVGKVMKQLAFARQRQERIHDNLKRFALEKLKKS